MNLDSALKRVDAYERLIRLDKPIGTLLLLWPTLWALWIAADGKPPIGVLVLFVLGTFLMRSAGCAMNDWADRNFDAHVARTRGRPLAAGEIAPGEALAVGAVLALLAFGVVLLLNLFAILLSFAALAIACLYPFTKRVFPLPQLCLGVAWQCWLLFAASILYGFAYDTEYAMVDRDDDLKIGIRTSAITLGHHDVTAVMTSYAGMLALLACLGAALDLSWPYYAGIAAAATMLLYHFHLIRERSRDGCFRAFRHSSWMGFAIFAGIVLSYELQ